MTPPSPPKISVALCTFNGERYLERQLDSMLSQTRLPDELLVSDDGSTDRTLGILDGFARRAPFPVRILRNREQLGTSRNFEQAILACSGEFIALSDQDDVWHPRRLALSLAELEAHPEAGMVFSDAAVIDDEGRPLHPSLWHQFAFDTERQQRLRHGDYSMLARYRFVTGATVMFRSSYRSYCFPVGSRWVHDGWMAMRIACLGSLRMIAEPLISYRRHASQQVGFGEQLAAQPRLPLERQAELQWGHLAYHGHMLDQVCHALPTLPSRPLGRHTGAAAMFLRQRKFFRNRRTLLEIPRLRRIPYLLAHWGDYRRCAQGFLSMLRDIVMPIARRREEWYPGMPINP